ncbi:MAG: hypothetical protein V4641_12250 [Pseudomonadota bacterium]
MQFETIAIVIFALAVLLFLWTRRGVITGLKNENVELALKVEKLREVAVRQRDEIDKLITTAEQERRARQMATLSAVGSQTQAKRPPATPPKNPPRVFSSVKEAVTARQQEAATNTWEVPPMPYMPSSSPSPAPAPAYHGGGGSFDGGGASGDYGRSDSCSTSSSSSSSDSGSSYDSGSSSSSDSGSSCSSD